MLVREKGSEDWEDSDFFTGCQYEDIIAEKFAEWNYNMEPGDPNDFEMVVEVLNNDGEIKLFDVSAEVRIDFSAEEREGD
jgi:hypothetical protein